MDNNVREYLINKQIEESYKVEEALNKQIDQEIEEDREFEELCDLITTGIVTISKYKAKVDGKEFMFTMKVQPMMVEMFNVRTKKKETISREHIVLFAADINKFKLSGGKYIPFVAKSMIDKKYSLKDNARAVVKAMVGKITGNIKPEVLDD